jgi:hypothetical protein
MIPRSVVTLRRALPEDAPPIAEIWHLGWRDRHLGFVSQELIEAPHKDSFRRRAAQRVNDTTLAVVLGQIAGFVMVVDNEVEQVYVSGSIVARRRSRDAHGGRRTKDQRCRVLESLARCGGGECESPEVLRTRRLVRGVSVRVRPQRVSPVRSLYLLIDM